MFCFLVVGIVALELELLCLQVIAGIVLVRDGNRDDVQRREVADDVLSARHVEHLEDAGLRAVVRILGAAFALGDPDRLVRFFDGMVDVGRELVTCLEHLPDGDAPLDDEAVAEPYEGLDPRTDEKVVADGDLGQSVSYVVEDDVQERSVEHDVAMIGNERAGRFALRKAAPPRDGEREGGFLRYGHHRVVSERSFKLFFCLASPHGSRELIPIQIRLYREDGFFKLVGG